MIKESTISCLKILGSEPWKRGVVELWASHSAFLILSFLICKGWEVAEDK